MDLTADMVFLWFFAHLLLFHRAFASEEVKVMPGESATLQCPCPREAAITLVEWSRNELKSQHYIFYRNSYRNHHYESFKGRIELKEGDLTLILKNITISDNGVYECRMVFWNKSSSDRLFNESRCFIHLTVMVPGFTDEGANGGGDKDRGIEDGGDINQFPSLIVGLSVCAVLVVVFVVAIVIIIQRRKRLLRRDSDP